MLLTEAEVQDLTGFKQPAKQAAWFDENRITYFMSGHGRIKVTWVSINNPSRRSPEPDFSSLHKGTKI